MYIYLSSTFLSKMNTFMYLLKTQYHQEFGKWAYEKL